MNGASGISNITKVIVVAVVAVALIVGIIVYNTGSNTPSTALDNTGNGSSTGAIASLNGVGSTTTSVNQPVAQPAKSPSGSPAVKTPTVPLIKFITPVANDVWQIGKQNPISWSSAANFSGSISLLSAATNQMVGVILPNTGPNQTSYTWNTRDVFLDRSNAQKKDVVPGNYKIEIIFDGNNLKPIISPAFTITN